MRRGGRRRPRPAPIRIRRATPDDAAAMARVMRAAVRAEAGRYPARVLAAWGSLPALYHRWAVMAGGERRLLACAGGRPLGFAGLRGREVTAVFVAPRAAGRGLGTRLLGRVLAEARRRGARTATVVAARGAVAFYRACGFRVVGRLAAPLPGGARLPAARMARALRRPVRLRAS